MLSLSQAPTLLPYMYMLYMLCVMLPLVLLNVTAALLCERLCEARASSCCCCRCRLRFCLSSRTAFSLCLLLCFYASAHVPLLASACLLGFCMHCSALLGTLAARATACLAAEQG